MPMPGTDRAWSETVFDIMTDERWGKYFMEYEGDFEGVSYPTSFMQMAKQYLVNAGFEVC